MTSPLEIEFPLPFKFMSIAGIIVIVPLAKAAFEKTVEDAPPLIVRLLIEPIVEVKVPVAEMPRSVVIK